MFPKICDVNKSKKYWLRIFCIHISDRRSRWKIYHYLATKNSSREEFSPRISDSRRWVELFFNTSFSSTILVILLFSLSFFYCLALPKGSFLSSKYCSETKFRYIFICLLYLSFWRYITTRTWNLRHYCKIVFLSNFVVVFSLEEVLVIFFGISICV